MSDRVLFPLMGLAAILMIALALVWPQGLGARSPGPFGHALARPAGPSKASAPTQPSMISLAPPSAMPSAQPSSSGPAQ